MTTEDLDRLDVLAAAATPGPWIAIRKDIHLGVTGWETNGLEGDDEERWPISTRRIYDEGGHSEEDAEFIAACDPATIRSLVAAVRERDELRAAPIDVYRVALALRAIHGDVIPLPNRPRFKEYAAMIARWYDDPELRRAALHHKDGAS